jgi:hypothetical protein
LENYICFSSSEVKGAFIGEQHINIILFLIMIVIAVMMIIDSEWFARLIDTFCGRVEQLFNVLLLKKTNDTSSTSNVASTSTSTDTSTPWTKTKI